MGRKRKNEPKQSGGILKWILLLGLVFVVCVVGIECHVSFWVALLLVCLGVPLVLLPFWLMEIRRKRENLQAAVVECGVSAAGFIAIVLAASSHAINALWAVVAIFCLSVCIPRLWNILKWALSGGVTLEVFWKDADKPAEPPAPEPPAVGPTALPVEPPVAVKERIPVPNLGTVTIGMNRPMSEQRGGMGRRLNACARDCVVLAITTTGSPQDGDLIEIAAIRLRDLEPSDVFCQLIKPRRKLTPEQTSNTGITNLMLAKAPTLDAVFPAFADFAGDDPIVSFETQQALSWLYDGLIVCSDRIFSNNYLDIQYLARKTLKNCPGDHLSDIYLCLGCPQVDSTRTMGRCETIMQCYRLMATMSSAAPSPAPEAASEPVTVDDLLVSVIDWILLDKNPTVPAIQKEFDISRAKAQQIMDEIELLGVVGPSQGSQPREVLIGINPLEN